MRTFPLAESDSADSEEEEVEAAAIAATAAAPAAAAAAAAASTTATAATVVEIVNLNHQHEEQPSIAHSAKKRKAATPKQSTFSDFVVEAVAAVDAAEIVGKEILAIPPSKKCKDTVQHQETFPGLAASIISAPAMPDNASATTTTTAAAAAAAAAAAVAAPAVAPAVAAAVAVAGAVAGASPLSMSPFSPTVALFTPNSAMVRGGNLGYELAAAADELDALDAAVAAAAAVVAASAAAGAAAEAAVAEENTFTSPPHHQEFVELSPLTDADYLALFEEQADRLQNMETEADEAYAVAGHFQSSTTASTPAKVLLYREGKRCYKFTPHTFSNVQGFKRAVKAHGAQYI